MGKRAGRRRHGDARLRVVQGGGEQPKRGTTMPGDAMQPLVVELRRRLRDDDPWQLLAYLSTLVEVTDATSPGAGIGPDGESLSIGALVETFIGVDLAETTAALSVLAVLVDDEHLVADIESELSHRRQPMPLWLRGLRETRVSGASLMSAVGDRGVNVVLGLSWAGGGGGAFLVYVDHLLGTVVKDAFPAPESMEEVLHRLEDASTSGHAPPGGLIATEVELPHARSLVEAALDNSDETSVDPGSDTWPAGRPILDWLLRTMPEGGAGWDALDGPAGAAARAVTSVASVASVASVTRRSWPPPSTSSSTTCSTAAATSSTTSSSPPRRSSSVSTSTAARPTAPRWVSSSAPGPTSPTRPSCGGRASASRTSSSTRSPAACSSTTGSPGASRRCCMP